MNIHNAIDKIIKVEGLSDEELELFLNELNDTNQETIDYNFEEKQYSVTVKYLKIISDKIMREKSKSRKEYYFQQFKKALTSIKTTKYNDINLSRWQEYEDILTDSLWIMNYRDKSGAHTGEYWGNFIPQIPNQLFLRYTKEDDWILDPFLGSGTSLIEAKKLGRNAIGIELQDNVLKMAEKNINNQTGDKQSVLVNGDSKTVNIQNILEDKGIKNVQFVIMHPPYWDIIKFSDRDEDLSNASNIDEFLDMLGDVIDNTSKVLEKGRMMAIVIGDKYENGQLVPLGFYCMQEFLKRGFLLKSTIVKNFNETKGKKSKGKLWRYRALAGGFYIFKHEYIFLFQKK